MKNIILILLAAFLFSANAAIAQKPGVVISNKAGWHKIGEVTASLKTETESIIVLGADTFKAIKLKVTDASVNLLTLKVYYETGEIEEIPVKSVLNAGEETRIMDLKVKPLKKVSFTHQSLSNSKEKAQVELYGLK